MNQHEKSVAEHRALIARLEAEKKGSQPVTEPDHEQPVETSLPVESPEPNEDFDFAAYMRTVDPEIQQGLSRQSASQARWNSFCWQAAILAVLIGAIIFVITKL